MRLGLLRAVVDELDEGRDCAMADQAVTAWDLDAGPARYLRASANVVFGFAGGDGRHHILRLTPTERRSRSELEAELGFVRRLAAAGVAVAEPVPAASGADVHPVRVGAGAFHATVFLALPGAHRELDDLSCDGIALWGAALGRLHRAARGQPARGRPSWTDQLPTLPAREQAARELLHRLGTRLLDLPAGPDDVGLVHGDFELDNVMWDGDRPAALDFDDCGRHWFVADIAMALRDLRDPTGHLDPDRPGVRAFLDGYRAERPLADAAVDTIPTMLELHDLTMFGLLLRTRDLRAGEPVPGWLDRLDRRLGEVLDEYRDRFTVALA
jgi:Ser/Thr protein kinase RdoA (MazF antagonist)